MNWIKTLTPYFFYQTAAVIFGFIVGWDWIWVLFPSFALLTSFLIGLIILLWITLRKKILKK